MFLLFVTSIVTLKEETFAVQENRKIFTFRGNKLSRIRLMKNFAGVNFRGESLSKDFTGIKKGEKLNL